MKSGFMLLILSSQHREQTEIKGSVGNKLIPHEQQYIPNLQHTKLTIKNTT